MKKLFLYIFLVLMFCNVGFAEQNQLLALQYYALTGEKKIQTLHHNYICNEELSETKLEKTFGFLNFKEELYYSKYTQKHNHYTVAISYVDIIKRNESYEWFTHETKDGPLLVHHKLEEGLAFNTYNYNRDYYTLKEYQIRDLRILLRRIFDLEGIINNKIDIRKSIIEYSEKLQTIFKSYETDATKTKHLFCAEDFR